MSQVIGWANFGGIGVPVGKNGKYLDWRGSKKNPSGLYSSYGPLHFNIGTDRTFFSLNFAELPDGQFILEVYEPVSVLHPEDIYLLKNREEVVEAAYHMTEQVLVALDLLGLSHDEDFYDADHWYFMRAVAKEVGREMKGDLRYGQKN